MISSRTTTTVLCGIFVLSILLVHSDIVPIPLRKPLLEAETEPYQRPPQPDDGRFHWNDLPIRFPVSNYEPVPRPQHDHLPTVQFPHFGETPERLRQLERWRDDIKRALQRCWNAYRERAWLQDELAPLSGTAKNPFGGWAATLIDTLDTLWIMDLREEFADAVNATQMIDFSKVPPQTVSVFETTIRCLGGLISAYDLSGDTRLLDKSLELADMLYVTFDTPNRMPVTKWDAQAAVAGDGQVAQTKVPIAEIGSFTLEFARLSQVTNDPKWFDAVHRITIAFGEQQRRTNLPGMWPETVNAHNKDFSHGTVFTMGAFSDSMYEYVPKMIALLGGSSLYERMYRSVVVTAAKHLLFRPMLPDNADVLVAGIVHANGTHSRLEPRGQHLACFAGGMLALGGRLIEEQTHVDLGRKVTDGCVWVYEHGEIGIMPESFTMVPCDRGPCMWNEHRWKAALIAERPGKTFEENTDVDDASRNPESRTLPPGLVNINDKRYMLRPEAIESIFVLYRVTGDTDLQDKAWNMWQSIKKHTETEIANAAIRDVTDPAAPKYDSMESFWTAETLKYFYLTFSEPSLISLDEYVFNTEAHPFRRPHPGA